MMMMTSHIDTSHQQQLQSPQSIADYLAQLLKDRKQLAALPNVFTHLERLLDEGMYHVDDLLSCVVWMNHRREHEEDGAWEIVRRSWAEITLCRCVISPKK